MLPTTGNFKSINCPFYDSCICERPYCHFKHSKKDSGIDNEQTISELVSLAVHKVLSNETNEPSDEKPEIESTKEIKVPSTDSKRITYNPTPISELNKYKNGSSSSSNNVITDEKKVKRHIPILYTPQRPQQMFQRPQYSPKSVSSSKYAPSTSKDSDSWAGSYVPSSIKTLQVENTDSTSNSSSGSDKEPSYSPSSKSLQQNAESAAAHTYNPVVSSKDAIVTSVSYSPTVITGEKTELCLSLSYTPTSDKPEVSSVSYSPTAISKQTTQEPAAALSYEPTSNTEPATITSYSPTAINKNSGETNDLSSAYIPTWLSKIDDKESTSKQQAENDAEVDFLDEFLNDPNLFETDVNSLINDENEKKSTDKASCDIKIDKSSGSVKKLGTKHKDVNSDRKHSKSKSDHKHKSGAKSSEKPGVKRSKNNDSIQKSKENGVKAKTIEKHKDEKKDKHSDKKRSEDKDKSSKSSKSKDTESKHEKNKEDKKSSQRSEKSSHSSKEKQPSKEHSSKERHSSKDNKKEKSSATSSRSSSKSSRSGKSSSKSTNKTSPTKSSQSSSKSEKTKASQNSSGSMVLSQTVESVNANFSLSAEEIGMLKEDDLSEYDSDDPSSALEECKRIFEEYTPPVEEKKTVIIPQAQKPEEVNIGKKRVAYESASHGTKGAYLTPLPRKSILSPAQMMAKRYQLLREKQAAMKLNNTNPVPAVKPPEEVKPAPSPFANEYPSTSGIKRIARVPNVDLLMSAKRKVDELMKQKEQQMNRTPIQTASKNCKRVAHIPEAPITDIPMVLQAEKSKLPVNVRSKYLEVMVKECLKLYSSKESAYERALNEEFNCYTRCSVLTTYRNSAMLTVNRIRKEADPNGNGMPSKRLRVTDYSEELSGKKFYDNVSGWILTQEELESNGYPLPGAEEKGHAIFKDKKIVSCSSGPLKTCSRCNKFFKVDDNGHPVNNNGCLYHAMGTYTYRGETRHKCCNVQAGYPGCASGDFHVFEIKDRSKLGGFVTTLEPSGPDDERSYMVVALDCEMVYTTQGLELARVTAVNIKCETIYESMVRPYGAILDCNTRFSGITLPMISACNISLFEVQAALLHLFNSKTILIGHSLESDLKALRMIHSTVIDTSVLFPHKYPPKKYGLKRLASEYLKKIIQNSESGHDSAEDAIACMELVMWKLKEVLKAR